MRINGANIKNKKLFVFDLDGTLAESKLPMEPEMEKLLAALLRARKVAVIGGGQYSLFQNQLLQKMRGRDKALFRGLFFFPTNATRMYRYEKGWRQIYEHRLSRGEIKKIKKAF